MKQILIDRFIVPRHAVPEFRKRMAYSRDFIRDLAGFERDEVYERNDEKGNLVVVTLAVWKNEEAIKKAKDAARREYERIGFRPAEMFDRLGIAAERDIYHEVIGDSGLHDDTRASGGVAA